ncbi:mitochondrial import protein Pam17 [Blastocladiella britannica]|nr:mitochondrial import protein Pam17 [Blastocladiella britannica]
MVSAAGLGDATPSATGPAVSANNLNSNNNNNNKSDAPTWAEYLAYRKAARTRNRIFTFVGSPAAFVTSSLYVAATYQFDPTVPIFGIEAAMVVGAGALSLGAVAATATPLTLDALWRAATSKTIQRMEPKEKELFRRVLRHRADASLAGPGLALFDYYGTSITSFAAYRNWLRKQRKIKEKGTFGEVASIDL